jgi:transposase-like protein
MWLMEIKTMNEPKSLQEAMVYFSNPDNCLKFLVARRWPNGVVCPTCSSEKVSFNSSRRVWQCSSHHTKRQFSVKVGTIFEDSPISLDKWLTAMWMVANCKNGVSSWEIHRALGITQKSAWFMLHRLRLALQTKSTVKLGGGGKTVEVDETFIGGLSRNMHKEVRKRKIQGTGGRDKTLVVGFLERGGKVRTSVPGNRRKTTMHKEVKQNVSAGSILFTDELPSYNDLAGEFAHKVINHAVAYVDGAVHTNGMENYWSLLKRGIKGTYVSVEPFHLFRYLDEQAFRFNNRATENNPMNDADRFDVAVSQIMGKRLTYVEVTGKVGETSN